MLCTVHPEVSHSRPCPKSSYQFYQSIISRVHNIHGRLHGPKSVWIKITSTHNKRQVKCTTSWFCFVLGHTEVWLAPWVSFVSKWPCRQRKINLYIFHGTIRAHKTLTQVWSCTTNNHGWLSAKNTNESLELVIAGMFPDFCLYWSVARPLKVLRTVTQWNGRRPHDGLARPNCH